MKLLRRLVFDIKGASVMEYTLMAALLAAGVLLAVQLFGSTVGKTFTDVNAALSSSAASGGQATVERPGSK
jgi:pilus assembly protein Flp/PilA